MQFLSHSVRPRARTVCRAKTAAIRRKTIAQTGLRLQILAFSFFLSGTVAGQNRQRSVSHQQRMPRLFLSPIKQNYDLEGRRTETINALGNTTWTQYNVANMPFAVTDALGTHAGDPAHTTTSAAAGSHIMSALQSCEANKILKKANRE